MNAKQSSRSKIVRKYENLQTGLPITVVLSATRGESSQDTTKYKWLKFGGFFSQYSMINFKEKKGLMRLSRTRINISFQCDHIYVLKLPLKNQVLEYSVGK